MKQNNNYSCGPVSSANAVINLIKSNNLDIPIEDETSLIDELARLEKTKTDGTSIKNLCYGIEEFFRGYNIKLNISCFGFINVDKKYQTSNQIDFSKIHGQGIINFGMYEKNSKGVYKRIEGHFINLVGIDSKNNKLLVTDPYNPSHSVEEFSYIHADKIKVVNKSKHESFEPSKDYYLITTPINYLGNCDTAIINGVIIFDIEK